MAYILRIFARLPLFLFHTAGAALGWLVWMLSPRFRRLARENLASAGYPDPALARRSAMESGKAMLELIPVWFRPQPQAAALLTEHGDSLAVIERARAAGKGVIFVTPHLGCFEVTAQWYAQRQGPMTALFSPPKMGLAQRLVLGRGKPNLKLATPDLNGVRALMQALRAGEAVGILPDQVPSRGQGEWAEFFGRPAYTMTLVDRLAERTGAPIVLAYAERLPGGAGFLGHAEAMPVREVGESAGRHLNRALEGLIRRCPAQYLWSYNRYKRPPGVEPFAPSGGSGRAA
jgi:KDO2-lipid IV(A) lauroyltransferase